MVPAGPVGIGENARRDIARLVDHRHAAHPDGPAIARKLRFHRLRYERLVVLGLL